MQIVQTQFKAGSTGYFPLLQRLVGKTGWFAVLFLLLLSTAAHAQFRASLRGTISDPTGAVVPGATVTLLNKDTNETKTSVSDGSGIYTFNALPAGRFSLTAQRDGFKKREVAEVTLIQIGRAHV